MNPYVLISVIVGLAICFCMYRSNTRENWIPFQNVAQGPMFQSSHPNLQFQAELGNNYNVSAPGSLLEAYNQEYGPSLTNQVVRTPKHIKSDREIYEDNKVSQVFGWAPSRQMASFQAPPIVRRQFHELTVANASDPASSNPEWSSYFDSTFDPNMRKPVFSYEQETEDHEDHLDILYQIHQLN